MRCLKRPFDDQSQPRIRLESEGVLALLALQSDQVVFVRSRALRLENALNPVATRAESVNHWLLGGDEAAPDLAALKQRTAELMQLGFKSFDALHVASAEQASANYLGTCDDRLLAVAARNQQGLKTKVVSVLELARELIK
jgi:hypothetical protein